MNKADRTPAGTLIAVGLETIEREELKAKLERGEDFKLVMAFGGWRFRAVHIPGSLSVSSPAEATELLQPDDEIVVYCMSRDCAASKLLHRALLEVGYGNVRRYPEGVLGWQDQNRDPVNLPVIDDICRTHRWVADI